MPVSKTHEIDDAAARRITIGGWLSNEDGKKFQDYADLIGLDLAALATLLIVRELNHGRLGALAEKGGSKPKGKRITAASAKADLKAQFSRHAAQYGLSSDAACSLLFRAEVAERWLSNCLGIMLESA